MQNVLIAIDPGVRGCGVVVGVGGEIVAAKYVVGATNTSVRRAAAWAVMASSVGCWVNGLFLGQSIAYSLAIELPQVYQAGHQVASKSRTDPNDLIELAATVGALVTRLHAETTVYLPAEWKQQVPKPVMHERASKRLSGKEIDVVNSALREISAKHKLDVLDAVAIFLKHAKRW